MPVSHLDNSVAEILAFGLNEATGGSYSHLTTSEDQMLALLVSEMTGQEYSHLTTSRETLWELLLTQAASDGITFDRNTQSNEQIAAIIANNVSAGGGYEGPLDLVPGAVVAYGQRALSAAMRGTALYTIREDSGDTEQAFNSDAVTGDAPVAAITAFLGGANGFVKTWNDQSGSGIDLETAANINQDGWAANQQGGKPAIGGSGGTYLSNAAIIIPDGAYTVFAVSKGSAGFLGQTGGTYYEFGFEAGTPWFDLSDGANEAYQDYDGSGVGADFVLWDGVCQIANHSLSANGAALTPGSNSDTGESVGAVSEALEMSGLGAGEGIQELIIYQFALNASQRLALRQNIATYYGITLP